MGLWRFLFNENFHYFPEGALEVCPYLHVPRVKRESKYAAPSCPGEPLEDVEKLKFVGSMFVANGQGTEEI